MQVTPPPRTSGKARPRVSVAKPKRPAAKPTPARPAARGSADARYAAKGWNPSWKDSMLPSSSGSYLAARDANKVCAACHRRSNLALERRGLWPACDARIFPPLGDRPARHFAHRLRQEEDHARRSPPRHCHPPNRHPHRRNPHRRAHHLSASISSSLPLALRAKGGWLAHVRRPPRARRRLPLPPRRLRALLQARTPDAEYSGYPHGPISPRRDALPPEYCSEQRRDGGALDERRHSCRRRAGHRCRARASTLRYGEIWGDRGRYAVRVPLP